ncbi:hypothetical protein [Caviibacter abscessus]|uniref:hypothetical protein n=1 Tax=Caviibacter abscessus TaxID=1766719 RepID=UPI00082DA095|nr:hypothetical protein [Caviibacter abscessus]
MKKILFAILIMSANLIFASSKNTLGGGYTRKDKEVKIGINIGLVRDAAWYYDSEKNTNKVNKEATLERYAMSGELQAKFFKNFSLKEDIKIKIGVGSSIYIQYDKPLHTGFRPKNKYKNDTTGKNNPSLPNLGSGESSYLLENTDLLRKLKEEEQEEKRAKKIYFTNLDGMVNLAEGHIDANFSVFSTLEIEKIVNSDFSVYVGADLGADIALHHCIAESDSEKSTGIDLKFVLERRKFILPHARGYFGVDYKNFEIELGAGYPKFITFGFGYRFKF